MYSVFNFPSAQSSSLSSLFGLSPVNPLGLFSSAGLSSLQNASSATGQTHISGYGQLLSALSTFQTSIKDLKQPNSLSSPTATSASSSVATATATSVAAAGTYSLNVTTLARAQSATSAALVSSDTILGSGTLSLQIGSVDAGNNGFTSTRTAVSISVNNGTLSTIARSINDASAGVSASVSHDSAGYHLQLQSSATGAANGFKLTTVDADGTNTNTSGLSQLAFDPVAASGNGKNLSQIQAAGNAAYTVNGVSAVSATNTAAPLVNGVTVNLLQTGAASISVTQDFKGLQASAEKFVEAFNTLQNSVSQQLGSGGPLQNDVLGIALAADVNQQAQGPLDNSGSALSSLSEIGINFRSSPLSANGGSLTLDSSALETAFNKDPKGTVGLLAQAAQTFDTLAEKYGGSNGSIQTASQGLQLFQSLSSFSSNSLSDNFSTLSNLFSGQSPFNGANNTRLGTLAIQAYAQDQLLSGASGGDSLLVSSLFGSKTSAVGSLLSTFA